MQIRHHFPRAEWPSDLLWLESLRAPGFNWSMDSLLKSSEFVRCSVIQSSPESEGRAILAAALFQSSHEAHELLMIAARPEEQGKGHSSALLESLIDEESHDRPWWLEVHENNKIALGLYISKGFGVVGRRAQYYSDGAACILMSRPINAI